ncbi:TPA: hypothetical protein ACHTFF_003719 [Clostridioides difficile]|uniref:Uncharacterized protein n=2 Tax=root TaxID=1 RepID=A0A0A8WJR8_9CAUD|nr:hypothetical protein [Clostridioides difficile]YP_009202017.1 hypothetical protein PHICD506_20030 [Clostridium phage phiCD506]EGT4848723.1 hypothetical protein [Clostridioides difficile]EGT4984485.1 hypothetical protein [Clostridioides difficile]EGT5066821.1 hypothetical protein [Clostridioides difficile]EQK59202.1 hypothetical protein C676_2834 [Clostridioides difficile F548]MBH7347008.1 hypothetical protein [Clostridioides difficile]
MKKITKKEIIEFVRDVVGEYQDWKLKSCGFYIKDNELNSFVSFEGKGIDINVYKENYDEIIYIEDYIKDYKRKEYNLKEIDSIIYEDVNEMISNYNEK